MGQILCVKKVPFCKSGHNFIAHNFLYQYAMALQFSALNEHLIGIMMQVTEWKYTFPVLIAL